MVEDFDVQDVHFHTDTIKFRKEKYYSPGQKRTYLANMPAGYQGQFGPEVSGVRTLSPKPFLKIAHLPQMISERALHGDIEVDGGIYEATAPMMGSVLCSDFWEEKQ